MAIEEADSTDVVLTVYPTQVRPDSVQLQATEESVHKESGSNMKAEKFDNGNKKIKSISPGATMKEILPIFVFSVALPTFDVFTDLTLALSYYCQGHPYYASVLISPFLLNYILTWWAWKKSADTNRDLTWVPMILACYPQYRAAVVIWYLYKDMKKGLIMKRVFEREISEIEILTEAVPTSIIMTVFAVIGIGNIDENELIFGKTKLSFIWFFITYATSVFSAAFGLAKCLKVGPCRILGEGGALGGLCTTRFLLLLSSMGFTLIGKGIVIAVAFPYYYVQSIPDGDMRLPLALMTLFLPNILLSFLILCNYKSCLNITRSFMAHPSLVLLPVFTHFTFSSGSMGCRSKRDQTSFMWSKKYTIANVVLSVLGHCIFGYLLPYEYNKNIGEYLYHIRGDFNFYIILLEVPILGMVLTLLFCYWDSICCCSCSPSILVSALLPEDPHTEFVVGKNKELVSMDEWKMRMVPK